MVTTINAQDIQTVYHAVESIGKRLSDDGLLRNEILAYLTGLLKPISSGTNINPEDIRAIRD